MANGWFKQGDYEFYELARQEYTGNECVFSVGLIEGHAADTHYLRLEKADAGDPTILLLRADELASIAWLCSGALWSKLVGELSNADHRS